MNTKVVIIIVTIVATLIVSILISNNIYLSATEVLKNVDFNKKNSVEVEFIDREYDGFFKKIDVSEETQQQLIEAFKNAEFKKTDETYRYDYFVKMTLNTGYPMYISSDEKAILLDHTNEVYEMTDESNFFSILKNTN